MADKLKVDIPGLIQASSDVGNQASVLAGAHRQSVTNLSEAESGWVGSSSDALVAMAGKWDTVAAKHHAAIEKQAAHMDSAAQLFNHMEERNASELKAVADQTRPIDH